MGKANKPSAGGLLCLASFVDHGEVFAALLFLEKSKPTTPPLTWRTSATSPLTLRTRSTLLATRRNQHVSLSRKPEQQGSHAFKGEGGSAAKVGVHTTAAGLLLKGGGGSSVKLGVHMLVQGHHPRG